MEEQAFIQWHALQVGDPTYLTEEDCAKLDALGSEEYRRRAARGDEVDRLERIMSRRSDLN